MAVLTVAVGILFDNGGRVLVTRREKGTHQGGLWEFPGGKVEPNETIAEALSRELQEELGVLVETAVPFMVIDHDYGDKQVKLDVYRVTRWQGEARGLEGQPLAWKLPVELVGWRFPAANTSILERLLAH
jgi:8-oxo-dGTP diphosphatase